MTQIRFGRLIVLACMGLAVACTSGTDGGTSGNTELNLDIINPGATSGELGFSIDRVDYRITCAGNPPGSYPIPDADTIGTLDTYDDSVDISGAFETVDTRVPPVWQAVMDLPPGLCTITLSVLDGDEVVCIGSQTLTINEDATTKYDIVLVCSLSIDLPDGMADVDGEFIFITGNLCPKLYVLNAIPSTVSNVNRCTATGIPCADDLGCQPPAPGGIVGQTCQVATEIQYRAKDPDNTCGTNCDPQTCTFDNPPICTPAPYNPNDPLCNPAAGGDPNSAACQDGVSAAGLVCTIAALPSAAPIPGTPGGTFISPSDLITPVGPVLPVNLNTASGIPGIILPGLGGPVTTSSEPTGGAVGDNPLYPGLPNVNGSLPPLRYGCDLALPGPVLINLHCSDGDEECDQNKQLVVECPGENFCSTQPIVCDSGNDCTANGTCDPFCDPLDLPSCADGQRCDGQGDLLPEGTICNQSGGSLCDGAGNCAQCLNSNPTNCVPDGHVPPPVDCQEPPTCDGSNQCVPGGASPAGTPCSNGECDGLGIGLGSCVFVPVDPCQDTPVTSCEKVITVSCGNNVTADVSILPYLLQVDPTPIIATNAFTADLTGVAEFSETFLDAAQGAVPGGVTKASLVDLIASVQTRGGGATGATTPVGGGATIPYECVLGDTGPGAQQPCLPANDVASVPGVRGNTDCVPTGTFNPCGRIVVIPTSADCAPAGVCDGLGKLSQCTANGFCVTGGLPLPLDPVLGVAYTAGDGVTAGQTEALFGWADNPPNPLAVGVPATDPDGTWNMLQPTYTGVAGDVGLAVNAGGLAVQLECVQGVDSILVTAVPDDGAPTPDADLLSFPVQVP